MLDAVHTEPNMVQLKKKNTIGLSTHLILGHYYNGHIQSQTKKFIQKYSEQFE